jgi:peptide/nickel transport system substrate-binding protein
MDVPNLEPRLEAADAWHRRKALIYENLTWVDNYLNVQPRLAESWETQEGVLYPFTLRKGVRFHNDKELDAEDVKYSLERQLDENVGSPGRGDLLMIDKIEVVDRYTLRIRLKQPSGPFLVALGSPYNAIISKGSAPTGDTLSHSAIGTGPFMVEQFLPGQRLVLKKNPQ